MEKETGYFSGERRPHQQSAPARELTREGSDFGMSFCLSPEGCRLYPDYAMEHRLFDPLPLSDVIKMNKLVRGAVRIDDFESWYAELPDSRRKALTYKLVEYAFQAGASKSDIRQAARLGELPADSPVITTLY